MKRILATSTSFAMAALAALALADLAAGGFYQAPPRGALLGDTLLVHGLLFLAVLVLSWLGALMAYLPLRSRIPPRNAVFVDGLLFAATSFFAVVMAVHFGGWIAGAAWLMLGAALFAGGGCLMRRRPPAKEDQGAGSSAT